MMKITLEQTQGVDVIHLKGRIIYESENYVKSEIEKHFEAGQKKLVLDLSGLSYINSSGLGILINLLKKIRGQNGDMYLAGLSREISELFRITSLDHVFRIFDTVDEAVAAYS